MGPLHLTLAYLGDYTLMPDALHSLLVLIRMPKASTVG
jgi:hypothetical protein